MKHDILVSVVLAGYLTGALVSFSLMAYDKSQARRGVGPAARIAERTLLSWTLATGGLGTWLGLMGLRHKTHHLSFWVAAIAAPIVHLAIWGFFLL
jgi:uncharacterized membrane protein YsdA (DUF1294 family)